MVNDEKHKNPKRIYTVVLRRDLVAKPNSPCGSADLLGDKRTTTFFSATGRVS
jgi:hypothetical protein